MSVVLRKPLIKRVPQTLNYQKDITTYDLDNLYPQRVEEIMFRSALTNSGIQRIADFVYGDGWENNGDLVMNEAGQTANDILREISIDVAKYSSSFALHVNWNLLGEITDIQPNEFKYVRYGLPNEFGKHHDAKVNVNWENASGVLPHNMMNVIWTFPLYDPEFKHEDFNDNFMGQVLYQVPKPDVYPRATFDSVLDSAQTNGEIPIFELGNIQNGFSGTSIFKYPGTFETPEDKADFKRDIKTLQGAENANSILLLEVPDPDENQALIEQISPLNLDRLFEVTNKNVNNRIVQGLAVPPALLGLFPETGMFNQQDYEDSYTWMNIRTRNMRRVVERAWNDKIGLLWHQGVIDFGKIIENNFNGSVKKDGEETDNKE